MLNAALCQPGGGDGGDYYQGQCHIDQMTGSLTKFYNSYTIRTG